MIRGVAAEGEDVYFRTLRETFRVPLAGGAPTVIAKSPPGMSGPLWVMGDKIVNQPTGQPGFVSVPRSGGTWTNLVDATSDRSAGKDTLPTILHNVGRGRVENAQEAVFDGKSFFWIAEDIAGASMGRKGTSTWSVRRSPVAGGNVETLYTSNRALAWLVKAGDRLVFERNDTPEKALPPGAKKPSYEPQTWGLLALPEGGGAPEVRVASVDSGNGTRLVTDGVRVYFVSSPDPTPTLSLVRVSPSGHSSPERVDDWVIEVRFGSPYGVDRFLLVATAMDRAPGVGVSPETRTYLYTGNRTTGTLDPRVCLANAFNPHAYAVLGKTLLLASQVERTSSEGVVKWSLP